MDIGDPIVICVVCKIGKPIQETNGETCDVCLTARGECTICGTTDLPFGMEMECQRCGWLYDRPKPA